MPIQPEAELRKLFLSLFDAAGLRVLLSDIHGSQILESLPSPSETPDVLAFSAVQHLRRIGGIDDELFEGLCSARSLRKDEILRVKRRFTAQEVPEQEGLRLLAETFNTARKTIPSSDQRTAALDDLGFRMVESATRLKSWPILESLLSATLGERMTGYAYLFAHPTEVDPRHALLVAMGLSTVEDTPFGQYWGLFTMETIELASGKESDPRIPPLLGRMRSTFPNGSGRRRMLEGLLGRMQARAGKAST